MEIQTEETAKPSVNRKLNMTLARVLFSELWNAENPEGSKEDRKAAFKQVQNEYLEKARGLRKKLKKNGVLISFAEAE